MHLNPDEIIVLGDSLMIWGGEDSIYKRLETGLSNRYKPFRPFPSDDTSWCGNNNKQTEQYFLGGATIARRQGSSYEDDDANARDREQRRLGRLVGRNARRRCSNPGLFARLGCWAD